MYVDETITVISPPKGWIRINFDELWHYRELFYTLMTRDIKVKYKQTIVGAAWAILQPFFTMVVFSLFFGNLAGMPSEGLPYPIFAYAALVPWQFFSGGVARAANSLVGNAHLIQKVYFPRLVIPVSAILVGLLDFVLAFVILLGMMIFYGIWPTINIVFLPLFLLLAIIATLGIGLWLGALNVQFRDIGYIVPFLVQTWLFMTPIAYPSTLIENDLLRTLYGINPMVGVVEGFRWGLLGVDTQPGPIIFVSTAVACLLLISGLIYFHRMEDTFADIV
jgi:lipopolysaccharide transport system permease protein